MDYNYLNNSINIDNIKLPESEKINSYLLKNNNSEIIKGLQFFSSEEKFLQIHGFVGTGKRQYINYVSEFLSNDVIKLEYYCKESTVCDDILLAFSEIIEKSSFSKAISVNAKITTLNVRFLQQISSIKKPFLIVLHSLDIINDKNAELVINTLLNISKESNTKILVSTRAMNPPILENFIEGKKILLKAFSKEVFLEYLKNNNINATDTVYEDFYKYTRGYYYYIALSIKIIQAMQISLSEFLSKFNQSEMSFDSYIGITYINLVPTAIRNFFWFLRTIRHGLTFNALASFEIYDELSIEYLKTNLMIYQVDETIYVQDYFLQEIDILIPKKTEIKLHKYIINVYEEQLKASLKNRVIFISRHALRAEIEYHQEKIKELENSNDNKIEEKKPDNKIIKNETIQPTSQALSEQIKNAQNLANEKKYTQAIEAFEKIIESETIDLPSLVEARLNLARLYKIINDYKKSYHYYELVEMYYKQHGENINLNYLYYELTSVYSEMYKIERAINTIKKVIYSVDTPQTLMVSACILLGNIYLSQYNIDNASTYYEKAIDSLNENSNDEKLAELYFKYALINDDKNNESLAFEYYNKCLSIQKNNSYKSIAYSNMGAYYYDNNNYDDALACYKKAYNIEKEHNNFEGIYHNASNIAELLLDLNNKKALEYLLEAKKCAEFINDNFYMLKSTIALGDYYYNDKKLLKECLIEYFKALVLAENTEIEVNINKIKERIDDMKLRMTPEEFTSIENKYGKRN